MYVGLCEKKDSYVYVKNLRNFRLVYRYMGITDHGSDDGSMSLFFIYLFYRSSTSLSSYVFAFVSKRNFSQIGEGVVNGGE